MAKKIEFAKTRLGFMQMGGEVVMSLGRVLPSDKVIGMNIDFNTGEVTMKLEREAPSKKKTAKKATKKKATKKKATKKSLKVVK